MRHDVPVRTHPRPSLRALTLEGATQTLVMAGVLLVWTLIVAPWSVESVETGFWASAAETARALGRVFLVAAVVVLLGHVVPIAVLRQVSWLWTIATTTLLTVVYAAVDSGTGRVGELAGLGFLAVLYFVLPVVGVTIAVRTFVRPLRPSPELRTPITAASVHET